MTKEYTRTPRKETPATPYVPEGELPNDPRHTQNWGLTCIIVSQMAVYSISRFSRQLSSPMMSPQVQYSVNMVWDILSACRAGLIPKEGRELCSR